MNKYTMDNKTIEVRKRTFKKFNDNFRNHITFLIDQREQNKTIETSFKRMNIPFENKQRLKIGDFGFYINEMPELTHDRLNIIIERKHDIDELIQNFWDKDKDGNKDNRFNRNLNYQIAHQSRYYLLVETGTWENIYTGKYNSKTEISAIAGKLQALRFYHNIIIEFIPINIMPFVIVDIIRYYLRDIYVYGAETEDETTNILIEFFIKTIDINYKRQTKNKSKK